MARDVTNAYVVNSPFNRVDPKDGVDTRYEVGSPYDGPDIDAYLAQGLIVPAVKTGDENNDGSTEK